MIGLTSPILVASRLDGGTTSHQGRMKTLLGTFSCIDGEQHREYRTTSKCYSGR